MGCGAIQTPLSILHSRLSVQHTVIHQVASEWPDRPCPGTIALPEAEYRVEVLNTAAAAGAGRPGSVAVLGFVSVNMDLGRQPIYSPGLGPSTSARLGPRRNTTVLGAKKYLLLRIPAENLPWAQRDNTSPGR